MDVFSAFVALSATPTFSGEDLAVSGRLLRRA